uniref:Ig-like domain-containing protein n=1 Tax=Oryzias sinensis TaxID=183150 RepID=A0A8C7X8E1_9TELE
MCYLMLFFLCFLDFCQTLDVHQDPSDIVIEPSSTVQIVCTHEKTDYFQMLWYQQPHGRTDMKLIGYLRYSEPTMEKEYKDDYKISGDLSGSTAKNGSLVIQKAEQKSSAVYFCAASKAQ